MHRFWSSCTESRPDDSGFIAKGQPLMHVVCDGSWDDEACLFKRALVPYARSAAAVATPPP